MVFDFRRNFAVRLIPVFSVLFLACLFSGQISQPAAYRSGRQHTIFKFDEKGRLIKKFDLQPCSTSGWKNRLCHQDHPPE